MMRYVADYLRPSKTGFWCMSDLNYRLDFIDKQFEVVGKDLDTTQKAMGKIDSRLYDLIERVKSIESYLESLKKKGKL